MTFNSFTFILVYLPLLLIGWYGLNHYQHYKAASIYLIAMSFWFYGMFGLSALYLLVISIVLNYAISWGIAKCTGPVMTDDADIVMDAVEDEEGIKTHTLIRPDFLGRFIAAIGIILNLYILICLKYRWDPGFLDAVPFTVLPTMQVGFSFYTFSQISFLVDRARGEVPHDDFLTYLLWITYFPKLVEGPIVRYTELASQLVDKARRRFDAERFSRGIILFVLGMGKKVLLADHLAVVADYGFSTMYTDTITTIAAVLSYALQLYLDFSGFCDMAMGVGWMMNIELPVNFDSPYKETSFSSFWSKWHMTLTRFFTRYVYIPLGGSRKGRVRTVINVLIVFLLSGIWHGEEEHYLLWGLLTGILVVLYNQIRDLRASRRTHVTDSRRLEANDTAAAHTPAIKVLQRIIVMIVFCITLLLFRCDNLENALIMLRYLFRPLFPGWITTAASQLTFDELYIVEKAVQMLAPSMYQYLKLAEFLLLLTISLCLVYGRRNAREIAETCHLTPRNAILTAIILVWCMLSFSGVSTFLYFKY